MENSGRNSPCGARTPQPCSPNLRPSATRRMTPDNPLPAQFMSTPKRSNVKLYETFGTPIDMPLNDSWDNSRPQRKAVAKSMMSQSTFMSTSNIQQSPSKTKKDESLIEWFDRTVEKELKIRKDSALNPAKDIVGPSRVSFSPNTTRFSMETIRSRNTDLADASVSGIDIAAMLRSEQNTELLEAVDKLAKAEAMCIFAGAVKAAEQAAASVPAEFAEEAAAAGAMGFQAEVTSVVKDIVQGDRPIEVIGYVGITRPKYPKKPIH